MLKSNDQLSAGMDFSAAATPSQYDIRWIINTVLQYRWLVVTVPVVLMALAVIFVLWRPATYIASTQLQLTNLRLTFSREDAYFVETLPDPTFLETQLQVIRSDRVALSALTRLGLLGSDSATAQKAEALDALRSRYAVERAGQSNVVQIYYSAKDPVVAARVANGIATAYVSELQAARLDAAQSGSSWLREKLREVGPQARVIAEALPPPHKSNLRGIIIIAAAGLLGAILSVVGALTWRFLDGRVRTPEETTAVTGAQCLGQFPRLLIDTAQPDELCGNAFSADASQTFVIDNPGSPAWHAMRNVKAACQDCFSGKGLRYIGVTSTFAREGRSTIAANLALALAASNDRVLLVDADSFDPALSARYGGRPGLIDYMRSDQKSLKQFTMTERRTGLHFLPIGGQRDPNIANIWQDGVSRFLQETATAYDYVIFDLPTLGMSADLRASAKFIEGYLLVVGWQQVSTQNLHVGLQALSSVHERLLGTVLNNVDGAEARWTFSAQSAFSLRQTALTLLSANNVNRIGQAEAYQGKNWTSRGKNWTSRVRQIAFPQPSPPPCVLLAPPTSVSRPIATTSNESRELSARTG